MTIEESLTAIQPLLKKFQQEIDIVCSFCIDGKIKNITYDSVTKTLSEPFPDKTDDNKILILPFFEGEATYIKHHITEQEDEL